jgi:hypothetical protein
MKRSSAHLLQKEKEADRKYGLREAEKISLTLQIYIPPIPRAAPKNNPDTFPYANQFSY